MEGYDKVQVLPNVNISSYISVQLEGPIIIIQIEISDPKLLEDLTSTKELKDMLQATVTGKFIKDPS